MNNHEETNYRAFQEGPVQFRFVVRAQRQPHDVAEAARFATGFSQPLVVVPARGPAPAGSPRLRVEPADVLVTGFKPSDDGKVLIVRLFGASGKAKTAKVAWSQPEPRSLWLSDTSEKALRKVADVIEVPAWGVVTLRAEF